jgi:hypothetical protein
MVKLKPFLLTFTIILLANMSVSIAQKFRLQGAEAKATLLMEAESRNYTYLVDEMKVVYDKENMNLIFTFYAAGMETINPFFYDLIQPVLEPTIYPFFKLTVSIDDQTQNLKKYMDPVQLRVPGYLVLKEESFEVPVRLSLFSDSESLFYNLSLSFNIFDAGLVLSPREELGLTGNLLILIDDGQWTSYFLQ